VGILGGKRHIRKFSTKALEELGFTTRECTQVDELSGCSMDEHPTSLSRVASVPP
jgi:hypothetical protein